MRNYRGELAECTQSNLFIVKDGAALTPPLDAGLLPGITREFLFEIGAERGIPVREAVLQRRGSVRRRRGVPHEHDARGRADRAGGRSRNRIRIHRDRITQALLDGFRRQARTQVKLDAEENFCG